MGNFLVRRAAALRAGLTAGLFAASTFAFVTSAAAQSTIVDSDQTLDSSGNPYAGIQVENGAALTGTDLNIDQSSNVTGLRVQDGSADITGGTIDQTGTVKYVVGVRVDKGTASVKGTDISIIGGKDAGGFYTTSEDASIIAEDITIDLTATGATGGEPAAALKARNGTITSTNGNYTLHGDLVYGIVSAEGHGKAKVVSNFDTIETFGATGNAVMAYSDNDEGSGEIVFNGGSVEPMATMPKGSTAMAPMPC